MEKQVHPPKTFGFTRGIKSTSASKIYPNTVENGDDALSILSIDEHSPTNTPPRANDQFKRIPLSNVKKISSTGTKKGLLALTGVILVLSFLLIAPPILGVVLTRNPEVTDTTSTTTIAPNVTNVYWSFNDHGNDMYGVFNGVLQNGAQYSNTTYFGSSSSLQLNASVNQSFIVASPYLNLSYTSFTIEAWIYGYTLSGDNAIFSQCSCFTCQDQCLYLLVRNNRLFMSFMYDDIIGLTVLPINTWYHIAFVYDYSTQTQSVYLQGILDNSKSFAGPYRGGNASIVIGSSRLSASSFNGFIDNLKVTTRAKTADELLTAATLVVYLPFEGSVLSEDMGPNKINGTISNAVAVSGKVGQGLVFNGAMSSYLLIPGFQQMGQGNRPATISLWVNPYSINGGVLLQRQPFLNTSGACYGLIGLNYIGQISMLLYVSGPPIIVGPVLTVRQWTHLGYTYSMTNGLRMYVNGVYIATTGPQQWWGTGQLDYLMFGAAPYGNCGVRDNTIYNIPFQGAIDELYIYRRELTASEIQALANP